MIKGKIVWSSGVERGFECEDLDAFKRSMFGSWGGVPEGVELVIFEEIQNAAEEGEVKESDLGEHQNGDGGGTTAEASSGDSAGDSQGLGGEDPKTEEVKKEVELTPTPKVEAKPKAHRKSER